MTASAAQLLDELMGRNRNTNPDDDAKLTWESADICRHYLVKFCPYDLFTNTKSDLGICDKVHDDDIKREFLSIKTHKKARFEDDFIRFADSMLMDVDRRIMKGKQRLAQTQGKNNFTTGDDAVDEQIELISERITGTVNEAERLGNEGNVEEAEALTKLVDKLRAEMDQLKRIHENTVWHQAAEMAASQAKQMEVCDICGLFLIVGEAQQRIDDHMTGKQHMGFAKLREAIQEIRDDHEKHREKREKRREQEREDRKKTGENVDESGKYASRCVHFNLYFLIYCIYSVVNISNFMFLVWMKFFSLERDPFVRKATNQVAPERIAIYQVGQEKKDKPADRGTRDIDLADMAVNVVLETQEEEITKTDAE